MNIYEEAQDFLQINEVLKTNFKFFDSRKRSIDLIQITFKDLAVIWNLKNNEEFSSLKNYKSFLKINNYINTGYTLYNIAEKTTSDGLKIVQML